MKTPSPRRIAAEPAVPGPIWPADRVERRLVADLVPYARNARTHSTEQIGQIAASIREWGWTVPILIDESNMLIAGHGRILAAHQLDITEIPVMVAAGWTDAQKRAYVLADNKLTLNAGWDEELLRVEVTDIDMQGFDLKLAGFADDELAKLRIVEEEDREITDPDAVPEAAEGPPVTRSGDIWILGRHRLMCGDSTSADAVAELARGVLADLCFTSPPYGQQRDYKKGISDWDALMQGVFSVMPLKRDAQVLVNLGMIHRESEWMPYWDGWIEWMRGQGWRRFGWYVWDQGPGLPGDWNGRLAPSHEFVFHFNRVAQKARKTKESKHAGTVNHGSGLRAKDGTVTAYTAAGKAVQDTKIADSVIRVMRHKARGIECGHPAVFPVDLVSEMLTSFSDPDDVVFEPFCGSGTQLISAQKNRRTCLAMELAPTYGDICVQRWQNFTGQQAVLDGDGRTFDEVKVVRLGCERAA